MDQPISTPLSRRRCLGLLGLVVSAGGVAPLAACGAGASTTSMVTTPSKPTVAPPPAAVAPTPGPSLPPVNKVGDTLALRDYALTILATTRDPEKIMVRLQAQNIGTREVATSPASFAARTTRGEPLARVTKSGLPPFDGKVAPGDQLNGVVTYLAPPSVRGIKLYFTPEQTSVSSFVVALDEEAENNPFPKPDEIASAKPFAAGRDFAVGDAVVNQGVVVKCLAARADGLGVTIAYLIYNGGGTTIALAEPTSFDARDAAGIKGALSAASRATGALDSRVMPGDTLRVSLTWEFAAPPTGIKASFTDQTLAGDKVVWAIS